jgi:hypothetical protein
VSIMLRKLSENNFLAVFSVAYLSSYCTECIQVVIEETISRRFYSLCNMKRKSHENGLDEYGGCSVTNRINSWPSIILVPLLEDDFGSEYIGEKTEI